MKIKLEDVCQKDSSNLKQADVVNRCGSYPIFGASGQIGNVDFYHQDRSYVAVVKDGAGIGRTTLCPAKSSVIGTMQYLLPKENVLPEYLYYVVRHMNLGKYFTGATIPHIYFRNYRKEEFEYVSLDKQMEIVNILSKLEHTINMRQLELEKLDELVKARFVEMFADGSYPEMALSEVCQKITDGTHKTPQYQDEGVTFISAKNIIDGRLDFSDIKHISVQEYQEIQRRCQVERGDILLTKSGSLGMTAIVETDASLGLFESLAILKYDRTLLDGIFLCNHIQSDEVQRRLMANIKGVAVKHLHLNVIASTKVFVPPLELQKKFADFVTHVDKSKLVQHVA